MLGPGPHLDRVTVVPPGVDVDRFRPEPRAEALAQLVAESRNDPANPAGAGVHDERRPDEGNADRLAEFLAGERPTVLYVGKLSREKGVHLLLEALRGLDARAVVAGFGPERAALERDAGRRVLFTGALEHRHLAHLWPLADVSVTPSVFPEAFGMVAAEAAACGCPPLVARHSGLAEVAAGLEEEYPPHLRHLASFAPGDAGDLAAKLGAILALAEGERAALGGAARRAAVRRWSWDSVAARLLALGGVDSALVIVDCAIYRDGRRAEEPSDLAHVSSACMDGDGIAWIGLYQPDAAEFAEAARLFDLHDLAVEDAVNAHQRAKLERYGDVLFCVLRPARYLDETETVDFGELHVFAGPRFVITVRQDEATDLAAVRRDLEARPDILRRGPVAVLHAIMDRVVDDYTPVVAGIENDIDEIEDQVFGGGADASRRIYQLSREVIAFQRATTPLPDMLTQLMDDPAVGEEEGRYVRDVRDHALRVQEHADSFRELLQNILNVNLTLETQALSETSIAQSEQVKRISAWAAILFAPTVIGTIYGMNFEHMPELDWVFGYPLALGLMLAVSLILYLVFKRRSWI